MDTLIIGGLLVIGIGALIALFFVLRSDHSNVREPAAVPQTAREELPTPARQEPDPQTEVVHNQAAPVQQIAPVAETTMAHEVARVDGTTPVQEAQTVIETRTVPVGDVSARDGALRRSPVIENQSPLRVSLNGQFHELSSGLRSLQQQATEMEQRLSALNRMLENIERNQTEEK